LRLHQLIRPHKGANSPTLEGYFFTNMESVCKDVECTFGILKKRWKVLNNGLLYRDIKVCNKIAQLLDIILQQDIWIGQGYPIGDDKLG
jgi:hypothetical protein